VRAARLQKGATAMAEKTPSARRLEYQAKPAFFHVVSMSLDSELRKISQLCGRVGRSR